MDVRIEFGDSMLNSGRIIRLFAGRIRFPHFCEILRLHFAADGKQLVASYHADLLGRLFPISE